uniref:F-box/LRR-repeat protein 4 n=1 Tax=Schistosoma haematobium TaxID=6185 RepID=A0A094ZWW4_SCHHA
MARKRTKWELVHQFVHEVVDFSSQYGSESGTGFTAANIVGPCQVYPNYCDSNATAAFRTYGKWWRNSPSSLKPINLTPDDNDNYTSEDYVDLYFDVPVIPVCLQIYETYNPGAIVRISACYRRQPENSPVNMRKLQWTTLWKINYSNQDKNQLVQLQHTDDDDHYRTRQQQQPPLQLTYHSNNVCTTLACPDVVNCRTRSISNMYPDRCLPALPYDDENAFTVQYSEYLPQSRIFQPKLSNIRPYPTDLLRIEFDSRRCRYYTQIDAVRLSGWAELTDTTISRWSGQLEAPSSSSSLLIGVNSDSAEQSNNRSQNTLSFFSDLLRPCTPRLRASSYDLTDESMDMSLSDATLPGLSPDRLDDKNIDEDKSSSSALLPICIRRKSSGLIQIPPVGMNLLLLQSRNLVALPPGTICQSSLFGLTYLNEDALWRHGPLTRLPYEILLHIFSYLGLRSLLRCACVSRQFRCLVKDTLANMTSIDLQSFWPILNDSTLISLGKRLGQVNLTARAVVEYYTTGQSLVAPITLLRRQCREEEQEEVNNDEIENQYVANQQHNLSTRFNYRTKTYVHTPFAARVRSYSSNAAARLRNHTRLLDSISSNIQNILVYNNKDFSENENDTVNQNLNVKISDSSVEALQVQTDELNQGDYFELPNSHLRRLDMSWCGNYSMISPTAFGHFLTDACRYLTTLRLSSCKFLNDDCLLHIVNTCPYIKVCCILFLIILFSRNLRSLNLWRSNSLTATGLSSISEHCLQLEELDIGWCRNVVLTQESNCIVQLTSRVRHLKKLFLTGTNLLNSEELLLISQYLNETLEQLDIHGSTNITTSAIVSMLNQCEKLKLLDVSFCSEIHSIHLIKLRYLFPYCTIIDSIPDMNAEILGNQFPEMIIDEVVDDDDDDDNIIENQEPLVALPAPNPLQQDIIAYHY